MEFNTDQYVFSHGKEPRGRGSWAFSFNDRNAPIEQVFFAPHSHTFRDACTAARQEAKRRGNVHTIYVQP